MASGVIKNKGMVLGWPTWLSGTMTADEVVEHAKQGTIYIWGGWTNDTYIPITSAYNGWIFVLTSSNDSHNNYTLFMAIGTSSANQNDMYIYKYNIHKWVKYTGTAV